MTDTYIEDMQIPKSLVEEKSLYERMMDDGVTKSSIIEIELNEEIKRSYDQDHVLYIHSSKKWDYLTNQDNKVGYILNINEKNLDLVPHWNRKKNRCFAAYSEHMVIDLDAIKDYTLLKK
jgi:hypothetical protein